MASTPVPPPSLSWCLAAGTWHYQKPGGQQHSTHVLALSLKCGMATNCLSCHSCANSTDLPLNKGATSRGGESRVPAPYCPVTTSGSLWAGPSWAYPPWNDPRRDDGLALVEGGRFAVPLLLLISSISSHCVSMSTHFQQPDGGRPGACGAAGDNSSVPCHVLPPLPLETCWCLEGY